MKYLTLLFALVANAASAGCLDDLTTSHTIQSKIRGFYMKPETAGDNQIHYVIIDEATCLATSSGDVTLAATTKSHYYLSFSSNDEFIFSTLLSAQVQGIPVEFRIKNADSGVGSNAIAYVISPAGARSQ